MIGDYDIYEQCDWCGKNILFGNAMVTLNKSIEQIDRSIDAPDGEVTVIQCDTLLTLCGDCGNRLNGDRLREALLPETESKEE